MILMDNFTQGLLFAVGLLRFSSCARSAQAPGREGLEVVFIAGCGGEKAGEVGETLSDAVGRFSGALSPLFS
jgi:hypothetical protein